MDEATLQEFLVEADELLNEAEKCLLVLDRGESFKANYDSIFRVFHSLKGAAGMLNLDDLKNHMHKTEHLFQERKERTSLTREEVDFFLRATDCSRKILQGEKWAFDYIIGQNSEGLTTTSVLKAPTPTAKKDPRPCIYVVDDERELVEILSHLLQSYNFQVIGFTDPLKVVEEMAINPPMAVLSDISMPGLSGIELMKNLHLKDHLLPVVLFSGHLDKSLLLQSIQEGAYTVIEKPAQGQIVPTVMMNAVEHYRLLKLIGHSINMVMYQFSDLDDYLASQNKDQQRQLLKGEVETLQKQFRLYLAKNRPL